MTPLFFLFGGLAVLVYGIGVLRERRTMATWPIVPGKVVASEARQTVRAASSEDSRYVPEIAYEFEYSGARYRGSRVTLVPIDSRGTTAVNIVLQRYPVDQPVQVHVNPENPSHSVLEISTDTNQWAYAVAGLCLIGVALHLFIASR